VIPKSWGNRKVAYQVVMQYKSSSVLNISTSKSVPTFDCCKRTPATLCMADSHNEQIDTRQTDILNRTDILNNKASTHTSLPSHSEPLWHQQHYYLWCSNSQQCLLCCLLTLLSLQSVTLPYHFSHGFLSMVSLQWVYYKSNPLQFTFHLVLLGAPCCTNTNSILLLPWSVLLL
jgi:hypothetical protein